MIFEGVAPAGRMMSQETMMAIHPNVTVFSAGTSDQFANAYDKQNYRMFGYFLMDGILKGKTGNDLVQYVQKSVTEKSRMKGPDYE